MSFRLHTLLFILQKMTDTLTDKTQRLETEVKNAKQGHRSDVDSFDKERKQLEAKLSKVKSSLESVEATNKALKKEMSEAAKRQKAELDQAEEHINKVQRANQDLQHAKSEREKELREQVSYLIVYTAPEMQHNFQYNAGP